MRSPSLGTFPAAQRVASETGAAGSTAGPALLPPGRQTAARPLRRAGSRSQYV